MADGSFASKYQRLPSTRSRLAGRYKQLITRMSQLFHVREKYQNPLSIQVMHEADKV